MSHVLSGLRACPEWQIMLNEAWTRCEDPQLIARPFELSLVNFLMSGANRGGLQSKAVPKAGKRRDVEVIYTPRALLSEVTGSVTDGCALPSNEAGHKNTTYTIDKTKGAMYAENFDINNMTDMCQDNPDWLAFRLLGMMNAMDRKVEELIWVDMVSLVGYFGQSDTDNTVGTEKTVTSLDANGNLDLDFISDLEFAAMDAAYCGSPAYFGWNQVWKAFKQHQSGCCAQTGFEVGEAFKNFGMSFMGSNQVESNFLANHFISIDPGAVQLLTWNKYGTSPDSDLNFVDDGFHKRRQLTSPATGISYDMIWERDCDDVQVVLKWTGEAVGLPTDLFDDTDEFEGVTFVNEFILSNP